MYVCMHACSSKCSIPFNVLASNLARIFFDAIEIIPKIILKAHLY